MFVTCRKNQEFILFLCFIHFCIHPPSFFPLILSVHSGIFCLIVECKLLRNKTKLFFLLTSASELYIHHLLLKQDIKASGSTSPRIRPCAVSALFLTKLFLPLFNTTSGKCQKQNSSLLPGYMPNPDELKRVFDKFDSNKDGKISPDEYKAILRVLGKENMIKEVSKIFEVVDLDGDGFIDFREFVELHKREGGVKTTEIQCAFDVRFGRDGKISGRSVRVIEEAGREVQLARLSENGESSGCERGWCD
ncbi:Calmodulin-like protein 30 [Camellia lanceoleosa]|uniref:Calmodulin-like protein 30 n=1 Tax=Camellia lanceoleosa TaxID=1840588 RepID=A0ACC0IL06_9ERIC|nr:Calmodulin-like protein 30 [Camellia lanceoleosa]